MQRPPFHITEGQQKHGRKNLILNCIVILLYCIVIVYIFLMKKIQSKLIQALSQLGAVYVLHQLLSYLVYKEAALLSTYV